MKLKVALLCAVALAACAPDETTTSTPVAVSTTAPSTAVTAHAADSARLRNESTTLLCSTYRSARTAELTKQMIEAELAVRDVNQCSGTSIGTETSRRVAVARYTRTSTGIGPTGPDYDCGDFASSGEAQRFFLAEGGPGSDPNDLDRDGDGLACEWGTEIQRIASYRPPAALAAPVVSTSRATSGSRCYVGPRGGTYTITASGNKNYSGC